MMEAKALYAFSGNEGELSFAQGNILKILNEGDQGWYTAELNGVDGFVPANYIEFNPPSYFKSISKTEATSMLESSRSGCNYLVRPSETTPGELSLSVKINGVQHFKILRNANKNKYFLWRDSPEFTSINKLVEYYKHNPVSNNDDVCLSDETSSHSSAGKPSANQPPSRRKTVKAIYDFEGRTKEELTIMTNDVITVLETVDDSWSMGQVTRKGVVMQGLFPTSYVE